MDNSGNFSIQVVEKALALCGLQLIPFHSSYPRAVAARHTLVMNKHTFAIEITIGLYIVRL